jgi:hypothetical protein
MTPAGKEQSNDMAMRVRKRYFDSHGKETKVTSKVVDPETDKPLPGVDVPDYPDDIFTTVSALPFGPLPLIK